MCVDEIYWWIGRSIVRCVKITGRRWNSSFHRVDVVEHERVDNTSWGLWCSGLFQADGARGAYRRRRGTLKSNYVIREAAQIEAACLSTKPCKLFPLAYTISFSLLRSSFLFVPLRIPKHDLHARDFFNTYPVTGCVVAYTHCTLPSDFSHPLAFATIAHNPHYVLFIFRPKVSKLAVPYRLSQIRCEGPFNFLLRCQFHRRLNYFNTKYDSNALLQFCTSWTSNQEYLLFTYATHA